MLTAYDYYTAQILDRAGVDILLVGDSLGMVIHGKADTLEVTMEDVIYHTRAVRRGAKRALVVADMPFMSFQVSAEQALINSGRMVKEGRANAVKLEGGEEVAEHVKRISSAGIPVMGHIGLTPQSVNQFGGFKVQGKDAAAVKKLIKDAQALEEAGAFSIVLEGIPVEAAKMVTAEVSIPTIGIGAGSHCDGQVLVTQDMLGISEFEGKFVKRFARIREEIQNATSEFIKEVQTGEFPTLVHSYDIQIQDIEQPLNRVGDSVTDEQDKRADVQGTH